MFLAVARAVFFVSSVLFLFGFWRSVLVFGVGVDPWRVVAVAAVSFDGVGAATGAAAAAAAVAVVVFGIPGVLCRYLRC